jgi:hypothetical protein
VENEDKPFFSPKKGLETTTEPVQASELADNTDPSALVNKIGLILLFTIMF